MLKVIIHAVPRLYPDEPWEDVARRLANDISLLDNALEIQKVPEGNYSLEEMQGIVGGLIDILGSIDKDGMPIAMVINDEGKLENLPVNPLATILATDFRMIASNDYIVGDVLLAYDTWDELRPFTEEEYRKLNPNLHDRLMQYKMFLMLNRKG